MTDLNSKLLEILRSDPVVGRLYTIPVFIFFAKQSELSLALPIFRSEDICTIERDPIIDSSKLSFFPGSVNVESSRTPGVIEFYAVCGQEQGPETAAAVASYVMTRYQPKFAISIGVCAGIHEIKLNDVLFATNAVNYEAGKSNPDGSFDLDLHLTGTEPDVKNEIRDIIYKDESQTYKEGCMLTGSAVRKDADLLFKKFKDRMPRDVKGLDMEASAFFTACRVCRVVPMPVIKSISDMGDINKNYDTHKECIENATKAGLRFISRYFSKKNMQEYWKRV